MELSYACRFRFMWDSIWVRESCSLYSRGPGIFSCLPRHVDITLLIIFTYSNFQLVCSIRARARGRTTDFYGLSRLTVPSFEIFLSRHISCSRPLDVRLVPPTYLRSLSPYAVHSYSMSKPNYLFLLNLLHYIYLHFHSFSYNLIPCPF